MRYYVVINGESSLNIQGLAIQSLPNISKPLMRSRREEIDGRDGDIITKLGYSAYDKTLKIGLWGNYDINQVIAFFNQEGVITFSNEPDKYYNFTILNREDYINQLEAFREASITIHCQPYKYELNEQPLELENEYIEETGTSLTFENSIEAPMNIDLKGNTLQTGTPTPSLPIPVNVVSGDNDIVVCGKNILSANIEQGSWSTTTGEKISGSTLYRSDDYIVVSPSTTYKYSIDETSYAINVLEYDANKTYIGQLTGGAIPVNTSFTTSSNTKYITIFKGQSGGNEKWQIEKGTTITPYEAYNGTTYNIDLPVENLFDKDTANVLNAYFDNNQTTIKSDTTNKVLYLQCLPNTTYAITQGISTLSNHLFGIGTTNVLPEINTQTYAFQDHRNDIKFTYTTNSSAKYIVIRLRNDDYNNNSYINAIQIEYGSKPNTYTPYGTTPIELNKIGTYQDYFYKENDKWYLHKETIKIELNQNSEGWITDSQPSGNPRHYIRGTTHNYDIKTPPNNDTLVEGYANIGIVSVTQTFYGTKNGVAVHPNGSIYCDNGTYNNLANVPIILYVVLNTPTNTEITDTTLIEQLDAILEAQSKKGTTNITQINNDLPFIITASVLSGSNSVVVNNKGNIYSKPIMTIYGKGTIGVYLSDTQIFSINLGNEEYITLDTANMEAYKVGVLKNRLVSGDYNSFKLETGNNTLTFTGIVEKVVIENYSRWI